MAGGGWGSNAAAGAWGSAKQPLSDGHEDDYAPSAPAPAASPWGASSAAAAPSQGAFTGAFTSVVPDVAPSAADAGPSGSSEADIKKREAAVNQREAAVKKKEAELRRLENDLQASGALKKNNWPMCFPFMYHSIADEIPAQSQRVVKEMYICWLGLLFCLSYQIFPASVMLGYDSAQDRVSSWFLSLIYWATGVPLSFLLWYRRLYFAARDDSTLGMWGFFLFFGINTAFCIWCAIAFPFASEYWSFCGFIVSIKAFSVSQFAGTVFIIGASFWTILALWCCWCLKDAYLFYRAGGITAAKENATQDVALQVFQAQMEAGKV